MHEAAIAAPLLQLVLEELGKHEAVTGPLMATNVRIQAGLLMAIEPATLQGCFSIMAEETPAREAVLEVDVLPMKGTCQSCKSAVTTKTRTFSCPACGSAEVEWVGGNELVISSVQVKKVPA